MRRLLVTALLLALPAAADLPVEGGYIEVLLTKPASDLTDQIHKVDLSAADIPAGFWPPIDTSDGEKLRVANGSGTELARDVISFDDTAETGEVNVLYAGTTSSTVDQYIRVYWPRSTMSSYIATSTYGQEATYPASIEGYWPLDDLSDRTSNGNDLTANNTPTSGETGIAGDAYLFDDASTEYLSLASSPISAFPVSMVAWIKPDAEITSYVVSLGNSGTITPFVGISPRFDTRVLGNIRDDGFTQTTPSAPGNYSTGSWVQVGGTFSSGSSIAYTNGTGGTATTDTLGAITLNQFAVGAFFRTSATSPFSGLIDEVWLISAVVPGDSVAYMANNVEDPATHYGTWTLSPATGGHIFIPNAVRIGHADL